MMHSIYVHTILETARGMEPPELTGPPTTLDGVSLVPLCEYAAVTCIYSDYMSILTYLFCAWGLPAVHILCILYICNLAICITSGIYK